MLYLIQRHKTGVAALLIVAAGLLAAQRGLSPLLEIVAVIGLIIGLSLIFSWARQEEKEGQSKVTWRTFIPRRRKSTDT
jgi:membrane protein DedA with SNARE-associated domain